MKDETKNHLFEFVLGLIFLGMICFAAIRTIEYFWSLEKRIQQLEQRK